MIEASKQNIMPPDRNIACTIDYNTVNLCIEVRPFMIIQITVEDLAHMNKKDLYDYGIQTFSDAKLILQHARNHGQLLRQRSGSQGNRSAEGQVLQQQNVPQGGTDIEGQFLV